MHYKHLNIYMSSGYSLLLLQRLSEPIYCITLSINFPAEVQNPPQLFEVNVSPPQPVTLLLCLLFNSSSLDVISHLINNVMFVVLIEHKQYNNKSTCSGEVKDQRLAENK